MSETTPARRDPEVFPRAPRPSAVDLAEPLRSRWSPSAFDPAHDLSDEQVTTLLRAGQWAPSWGNSQPWHFVVARRGTPTHQHLVDTLTRGNLAWVPAASLVLVAVVQRDEVGGREPSPYALYDTGQAAAHITLQARASGLHAHQFAGFDHEEFAARLAVPGTHRVLTGIAVGRAGEGVEVPEDLADKHYRPRRRRPLAAQAFEGAWGEPWSGLPD